uniref:CUB_2 domain-containing protein n=1 Tax=Caenorhabditis tropicalis TaxID=1561998 RepID=A0A1I7V0G6_9PELO
MFLLTLLTLVSYSGAVVLPLNAYSATETLYKVNKTSRIYVISNSPQELLQSLIITTSNSAQNSNGFTLSVPQNDGSLTPFIPTQDNDLLSVIFNGVNTLEGSLYMDSITPNLNVFPLLENSSISFKQGTNVFFELNIPNGKIPVAQNVIVSQNLPLAGFVGLPETPNPPQFFDSGSIENTTTYNQLELPMKIFHFTSKDANVKYEIKYAERTGLVIGSAGLLMTNNFPSGPYNTSEYNLNNQNGIQVDAIFIPRLDKTRAYGGNITIFMTPETLDPFVSPMISIADSNITSNSPMNRIVIESDGPYAIQYFLRDTTITTPSPFETSTKSSSFPKIIASLLIAVFFRF